MHLSSNGGHFTGFMGATTAECMLGKLPVNYLNQAHLKCFK